MNQSKKIKIFVNILSLLRVGMIPVLYFIPETWPLFITVNILFITDFVDGFLARKYDATSETGALLDLLGDKFLVAYLMIWALYTGKLGGVIVFLVILREVLSMVIRFIKNKSEHSNNSIPASFWGKFKTVMQFVAFDMMLLQIPGYQVAFIIVLILGYYSLFTYFKVFLGKE